MINTDLKQQLNQSFLGSPQILVAYIIGSFAKGNESIDSDFDLALVVKNRQEINEKRLYASLFEIQFPKNLDLSIVDKDSSPLFLFQIASNGECVFSRSKADKIEFESLAMRRYFDNAHMRKIYHSYLKNKFT